ncbi:MAG: methionyl-tRNA formyltransferase [Bacilli bacterium]
MFRPRILFMGTPEFAVPSLAALLDDGWPVVGIVTQPDRPVGRKRSLTPSPVKSRALQSAIPVLQPQRVRRPEALEAIAALRPNMIVTAAYGQILPTALLEMADLGAFNVHASLLPLYRGAAPIQWALMNGEERTGITIMTMVKELDAGPIWATAETAIAPADTYGTLHDRLAILGAQLLRDSLPRMISGQLIAQPQDESAVTYAPPIRRKDEQIDFRETAQRVCDIVRALSPQPGAFTRVGDRALKIWSARPAEDWTGSARPGQFVGRSADGPVIACGAGAIVATRLQAAGRTVQSGADFLRGARAIETLCCTYDE